MRRLVLIATLATLTPAFAFAMGCHGVEKQAQSCIAGTIWDVSKQECIPQPAG